MKLWKRGANKKLRSKSKQVLKTKQDWDNLLLPHRDEVDNSYNSPMDGRPYLVRHKPDNDECFRDWSRNGGYRWHMDRKTKEWKYIKLSELVDGHFEKYENSERCDCICNKNGHYWKAFRK